MISCDLLLNEKIIEKTSQGNIINIHVGAGVAQLVEQRTRNA